MFKKRAPISEMDKAIEAISQEVAREVTPIVTELYNQSLNRMGDLLMIYGDFKKQKFKGTREEEAAAFQEYVKEKTPEGIPDFSYEESKKFIEGHYKGNQRVNRRASGLVLAGLAIAGGGTVREAYKDNNERPAAVTPSEGDTHWSKKIEKAPTQNPEEQQRR